MATLGNILIKLGVESKDLSAGLKTARHKVRGFTGEMRGAFNALSRYGGLASALTVAGAWRATQAMAEAASEIERNEAMVRGLLYDMPEQDFQRLADHVGKQAEQYGLARADMLKTMYRAVSVQIPTEDLAKFQDVVAQTAVGGQVPSQDALGAILAIRGAYDLGTAGGDAAADAQKVSDALFAMVERGDMFFAEVASYVADSAQQASAAGVSLPELGTILAEGTLQGTAFRKVSTQTRQLISEVSRPDSRIAQEIKAQSGGYTMRELLEAGNESFFDVLTRVRESYADNQDMFTDLFSSVEAKNIALAITKLDVEVRKRRAETLRTITESDQSLARYYAVQNRTASIKIARAKSGLSIAWQEMGENVQGFYAELAKYGTAALENPGQAATGAAIGGVLGGALLPKVLPKILGRMGIGALTGAARGGPGGLLGILAGAAIGAGLAVLPDYLKKASEDDIGGDVEAVLGKLEEHDEGLVYIMGFMLGEYLENERKQIENELLRTQFNVTKRAELDEADVPMLDKLILDAMEAREVQEDAFKYLASYLNRYEEDATWVKEAVNRIIAHGVGETVQEAVLGGVTDPAELGKMISGMMDNLINIFTNKSSSLGALMQELFENSAGWASVLFGQMETRGNKFTSTMRGLFMKFVRADLPQILDGIGALVRLAFASPQLYAEIEQGLPTSIRNAVDAAMDILSVEQMEALVANPAARLVDFLTPAQQNELATHLVAPFALGLNQVDAKFKEFESTVWGAHWSTLTASDSWNAFKDESVEIFRKMDEEGTAHLANLLAELGLFIDGAMPGIDGLSSAAAALLLAFGDELPAGMAQFLATVSMATTSYDEEFKTKMTFDHTSASLAEWASLIVMLAGSKLSQEEKDIIRAKFQLPPEGELDSMVAAAIASVTPDPIPIEVNIYENLERRVTEVVTTIRNTPTPDPPREVSAGHPGNIVYGDYVDGMFARGGKMPGNSLALVGEEGPEIINSGSGGMVTPNNKLGLAAPPENTVVINVNNPRFESRLDVEQTFRTVIKDMIAEGALDR